MKDLFILIVCLVAAIDVSPLKAQELHHEEEKNSSEEHGHEEEHGHKEEDEHEHGGGKAVGRGKAILEVSKDKGFKLSKEAFKALDVKFMDIDKTNFSISKNELVTYKNKIGIYRFRDGFFKFIPVTIKEQKKEQYLIHSPLLTEDDKIVTSPVGLIRITDVYSTDTAEYGHGH
jgi:hypothetical protein